MSDLAINGVDEWLSCLYCSLPPHLVILFCAILASPHQSCCHIHCSKLHQNQEQEGNLFFFPGERNVVLYFVSPSEVWVLNRAFLPLNQFSRNFLSFFGEGFALPVQCVGGIGVTWHSNQSLHWIWRIFRQISLPLIQWELFFSFLIRRNPPPRHYPVNFVEGTPHLSL